jgi:hypothetical protein
MVQLSATRCSCIAILWVSLVSFATITLCVASQQVFIVMYFVIDSVRKLHDTPSHLGSKCGILLEYPHRNPMQNDTGFDTISELEASIMQMFHLWCKFGVQWSAKNMFLVPMLYTFIRAQKSALLLSFWSSNRDRGADGLTTSCDVLEVSFF